MSKNDLVPFSDVQIGDVFISAICYYLKIKPYIYACFSTTRVLNAINITTGYAPCFIDPHGLVRVVAREELQCYE